VSWPPPQSRDLRSFDTPHSEGNFTQLHQQGLGHEGAGFTAQGGGGGGGGGGGDGVLRWCLKMVSQDGVLRWYLKMVSSDGVLR